MVKTFRAAVCVAALSMALPAVVSAQRPAPEPASTRRPYRGIFGGPSDPSAPQSLVLSGSLFGAYDDNVLAGLLGRKNLSPWLQRSGGYWGSSAGIDYSLSKPGDRVSFGLTSAAQLYYRQALGSSVSPYYNGSLSLDTKLTQSLTFDARQSLSYAPNYRSIFSPIDGEGFSDGFGETSAVESDPDLELFPLQTLRTVTGLTLTQRFTRNTSLAGSYYFRTVDVREDAAVAAESARLRDYRRQTGSLRFSHSRPLTSHAKLVLAYGVRVTGSREQTAEPRVMHNVNAGIDYSRALSFSRRTTLTFGTGSAIIASDNVTVPGVDPRTRYYLLGNSNLVHEMGRTWTAQLSYTRGLVARDGFGELYLRNAVSATVQGLVSRRLSLSGSGLWSVSSRDRGGQNGLNRNSASAQATYGLTQWLGLYTKFVYYQYDYGNDIPLDSRLARGLERRGVRVGLTTTIPLIR